MIHDYYGKLSSIMHGYSNSSIDITPIYKEFFGYDFSEQIIISTADILSIDPNTVHIFNPDHYPLLAETLRQTLIYYYLRMKVEKELVNIFQLSFRENDPITLNDIIQRAFRASPSDLDYADKRAFRVFFSSRKTLLNEFNHFEGNMNIFQPAIDIEADALRKEINDIERKLSEVRTWHDSASADEHP